VHVLQVDTTDVVAFVDDDGDVGFYAFQIEPDRILFLDCVCYEDEAFLATSFELASRTSDVADFFAVHSIGAPLQPRWVAPLSALDPDLDVDDLSELPGRLDGLVSSRKRREGLVRAGR